MQYFLLLSPASQFSGFCETSNGLFMQKIPKLEFIQNLNFRLSIQKTVPQLWQLLINDKVEISKNRERLHSYHPAKFGKI